MPKLPDISGKQIVKAFQKAGFDVISQKGSHIKLRRQLADRVETVIVPNHKSIKPGTLRNGILKPINMSISDLLKLLK